MTKRSLFILAVAISLCVACQSTMPTASTETTPPPESSVPAVTFTGEPSGPPVTTAAPTDAPIPTVATSPTNTSVPEKAVEPLAASLIVFYSERDGDAEIYVMNPDGSDQRPLTDNSADDFSPSWSPDGTLIAFESDRDDSRPRVCFPNCNYNLYVMDANGSDQHRVTALPGAEWGADWSPDGQSLVFTAGEIGLESYGIYKIDIDGGEPQPLLVDQFKNDAPDWSPDGAQIAFSSNRDGNGANEFADIFVMDADGGDVHKVVDTGLNDYFPDWAPDGAHIVFFAADWPSVRQDIYTVHADGSNLLNLTNTPGVVDEDPKWSPDGSRIIFQTDRDGNFEIYIMNSDGSQPQNLTRHPGRDYWPDWFMPPEAKIAFVSDHSGRPQIYLVPAPEVETQEAIAVGDWQPLTSGRYENYFPSWSPDGTQIAYYTHFSEQSWAIMLASADGSSPRQLTPSSGETICSFGPVWSPDGQRIAFTVEPNPRPTCEMKHSEIAVINTDGSGLQILTQNEANDLVCSWSPDGSKLVFTSNRDGKDEIYVMNADGSNPQRLTELESASSMPAFSPDGRSLAFVSDRDGNDEIYLMGADGSSLIRLTNNAADDWQPSWSPDGTQILFISGSPRGGFDIFVMDADGTGLRQLTDSPGWEFEPAWQP